MLLSDDMSNAQYMDRRGLRLFFIFTAFIVGGLLSGGCFVIRGERRVTPDARGAVVKVNTNLGEPLYCRVVNSPDFKLRLGAMHGPARWELQCLLNVLPINVEGQENRLAIGGRRVHRTALTRYKV